MNTFEKITPENINAALKALLAHRLDASRNTGAEVIDMTVDLLTAMGLITYPETGMSGETPVFGGAALTAQVPAVPVEVSVQPNHIICLEDGKRFKMMRRHLREAYDMSPDQYRNKWGLPSDYPMTAPNYAASKSQAAKSSGLGTYDRDAGLNGLN